MKRSGKKNQRVVPVPVHPIQMPLTASDATRNEFIFQLYGGSDPADKLWRQWEDGSWLRRQGTRESPLAFAVTYLTGAMKPMRSPAGEVLSFSEYHVALCEEAKCWMKPDGRRIGMIAPRGIGKSWWTYFALPLWALAHGHRNFFAGYSASDEGQAVPRLDQIRRELQNNELLLLDFPELAIPTGRGSRNNSHQVDVVSGRAFASNGIDKTTLGLRPGKYRPDLITIDDGEKNASNYAKEGSKGDKASRLATIRDVVLPMNEDAVVVVSGTVVKHDSIGYDLVQHALGEPAADWIAQERFVAMYSNVILDEGTPWERSIWPEWRSLESLKEQRETNPAIFALHLVNQPMLSNGRYWRPEDFRYDRHFPLDHFVMYIDPAVVDKPGRDKTAIVAAGADVGRHRAEVMYARQGHMDIRDYAREIAGFKAAHPEIQILDVYIERNNGGGIYLKHLAPLAPRGVRLHTIHNGSEVAATGETGKMARIAGGYAYYQANKVWHARPFPEFEATLTAYPKTNHDDWPDAGAGALRAIFEPESHRCTDQCALRLTA